MLKDLAMLIDEKTNGIILYVNVDIDTENETEMLKIQEC